MQIFNKPNERIRAVAMLMHEITRRDSCDSGRETTRRDSYGSWDFEADLIKTKKRSRIFESVFYGLMFCLVENGKLHCPLSVLSILCKVKNSM